VVNQRNPKKSLPAGRQAGSKSAGILVYRLTAAGPEFLLAHPGGPYFTKKDIGAWSIPKGEFDDTEEPLAAAKREFFEETGLHIDGQFIELSPVKQKSGKKVYAWAIEKDIDAISCKSNSFTIEWPYKSGKYQDFPEVDKLEWFSEAAAYEKINPAQRSLIEELLLLLNK
jgi:predicted NUDIX family NTP pyrophosphohydrolase